MKTVINKPPMNEYRQHLTGFLAPLAAVEVADQPVETCKPDEALFTFDSGRTISFAEGARSTLVLGNTGSGKTRSVLLPMLDSLLKAGFGGLVLDVKGNLGSQTRALARACGREDDIVEFGSGPMANATNLLAKLHDGQLLELFSALSTTGCAQDRNVTWLYKGGRIAAEVAMAMHALSKTAKNDFARRFTPTLQAVCTMLNNRALAQGLWQYYCHELAKLQKLYQGKAEPPWLAKAQALCAAIQAQRFHIFVEHADGKTTEAEQLTWMLKGINSRLQEIDTTKNLMARFSCLEPDACSVDFKELIYRRNKVVLVHFDPSCGRAAAMLSRVIKERFYEALYAYGLRLPEGRYTFMVGDEFQDIIDVSTNKLSDRNLFSVSREFRNINIVATQSVASLLSAGWDSAVDSLLANCTNKIFLQTRDPRTIEWAKKLFGADASVGELLQGHCTLDTITWSGNPVTIQDSVNDAFQRCRSLLGQEQCDRPSSKRVPPPMPLGLSGLPKRVEECLSARQDKDAKGNGGKIDIGMLEKMRQAASTCAAWWDIPKAENPKQQRTPAATPADSSEATNEIADNTDIAPKASTGTQNNFPADSEGATPKQEQTVDEQEDVEHQADAARLRKSFPQFFPADVDVIIAIPPGWLSYTEKAFQGFTASGLKLTIVKVRENRGSLMVSAEGYRMYDSAAYRQRTSERIMNALLRGTRGLCALCGNPAVAMTRDTRPWDNDDGSELAVCGGCLDAFGLLLPGTGKEADSEAPSGESGNRSG